MTTAAKWSIGLSLVIMEILLVVLGWNWMRTSATPPSLSRAIGGDEAPRSIWGAVTVNVEEAAELFCDGAVFLDLQSEADFAVGAIPNAEWIDYANRFARPELARHAGPEDKIVVYCEDVYCWNAYHAAKQMIGWDMPNVYYFREGLAAWNAERYAIQNSLRNKQCKRTPWQPKAGFSDVVQQ